MNDAELRAIMHGIREELLAIGIASVPCNDHEGRYLVLSCGCHLVVTIEKIYVIGDVLRNPPSRNVEVLFQMEYEHSRAFRLLCEWAVRHRELEDQIDKARMELRSLMSKLVSN